MSEDKKHKHSKSIVSYNSEKLKIYATVGEAAEAELIHTLNQTPLERIKETVLLILRVFPLSEKNPNTNKIYIDRF